MTFASDQDQGSPMLSPTSKKMLELRDAVFDEWEKRVRVSLHAAAGLRHPVLIDTFPTFYDNIAQAVTASYPRAHGSDGNSVPGQHGSERARLTMYDHQALVCEYQIFRQVVFDTLRASELALTHDETSVINTSIDEAIVKSVNAFVGVHAELHEKFFTALAHDLRGPLSAVSMTAEAILRANDPVRIRNHATKILDHSKRIDVMITELLDTAVFHSAHRSKMELVEFDMLDVLQEVCARVADTGACNLQLEGHSIRGWWGRSAIARALENLVTNAVKYGAPNTPVRIKLDTSNERLLLSVHNEGPTIPPHEQDAIFELYHRASSPSAIHESRQKGWGIGLPYVRTIAESHGGSVCVDSGAHRGTTFLVDIPVDARPFLDDVSSLSD